MPANYESTPPKKPTPRVKIKGSGNNNGSGTGGYRYAGKEWDDTNPRELRIHNERVYRSKGWKKGRDGVWRPPASPPNLQNT